MMRPEGYRKCIRLMKLADRFQIPVISFIDTPGAYPGLGAEQRGQASAIAHSIECCMSLTVPNISIIIGEGGSGGAIALASSNKVIMLENSIYSVISPEGCASILWRDPSKSLHAAEAMKLTAKDLLELKIIDEIIPEPLGGAHRDPDVIASDIKHSIIKNLKLTKGVIINVTSIASDNVHQFAGPAYATSKAALKSLTREMASDLANEGIRVNAIAPGEIETSMVTPKSKKMLTKNIPMKRFGTPEEVAGVIHSMCSDTFSYVNGTEIQINGGQTV